MGSSKYKPGDPVVYVKTKNSTRPGPRAAHVVPRAHGEDYSYQVEKFWRVLRVLGDQVVVYTRRGKQHVCEVSDRNLRKAGWLKYLRWAWKFPSESITTDLGARDRARRTARDD